MSDVRSSKDGARRTRGPQRHGWNEMLRDPVVRRMTYAATALVILFLATLVGALFTGVISRSGTVETAGDREVLIARNAALAPGATGESWAPYIDALTASGDLRQAEITLEHARSSLPATATVVPALDLSEARLQRARGRNEQAADMAETAMQGYEARRAARVEAAGDDVSDAAKVLEAKYYDAALVRAYACVEMQRWEDAVSMFDIYIAQNRTAADILIDRGNAKASLKDNAGAEADFREALRYVPYDKEAKAGLARIGAAQ